MSTNVNTSKAQNLREMMLMIRNQRLGKQSSDESGTRARPKPKAKSHTAKKTDARPKPKAKSHTAKETDTRPKPTCLDLLRVPQTEPAPPVPTTCHTSNSHTTSSMPRKDRYHYFENEAEDGNRCDGEFVDGLDDDTGSDLASFIVDDDECIGEENEDLCDVGGGDTLTDHAPVDARHIGDMIVKFIQEEVRRQLSRKRCRDSGSRAKEMVATKRQRPARIVDEEEEDDDRTNSGKDGTAQKTSGYTNESPAKERKKKQKRKMDVAATLRSYFERLDKMDERVFEPLCGRWLWAYPAHGSDAKTFASCENRSRFTSIRSDMPWRGTETLTGASSPSQVVAIVAHKKGYTPLGVCAVQPDHEASDPQRIYVGEAKKGVKGTVFGIKGSDRRYQV